MSFWVYWMIFFIIFFAIIELSDIESGISSMFPDEDYRLEIGFAKVFASAIISFIVVYLSPSLLGVREKDLS